MPEPAADDRWSALGDAAPPARVRRGRRRLRTIVRALGGVLVVLVLTSYVGYWAGANDNPANVARGLFGREEPAAVTLTGRESFLNNCAACHGQNGEGGSLDIRGPAFTPGGPLSMLTFEERVAKIRRGRPLRGMPGWKFRITDEEIRRVAAYTQLLSAQSAEPGVEGVR